MILDKDNKRLVKLVQIPSTKEIETATIGEVTELKKFIVQIEATLARYIRSKIQQ